MKLARCNICGQKIENANEQKINKHYKNFHNCKPLQECKRCGEKEILVELAETKSGEDVVIARTYCDDCVESPLEELLVRKVISHE